MPAFTFEGYPCHYAAHDAALEGAAAPAPLLLIHGAGGRYLHWPPHLRRLPARPVYAIDLPGHGQSPGPGLATMADFVHLVRAWVETLEIDTCVLGGHSLGSAIALSYALAQPARVQALLLVGAGPRLPVNAALLDLLQNDPATATARLARLSYGPAVNDTERAAHLQHLRAVDPMVLYRAFVACNDFDVTARLGEIGAPALILAGADDRMTPPALAEELYAGIRAGALRILPNTGHMIPIEQPQTTTAAVTAFLT